MLVDTYGRFDVHANDPPRSGRLVVVGFDGSEESLGALHAAIERTGPGDTIAVLHAYPTVADWMGYPFYHEAVIEAQEDARSILDEAANLAADAEAEIVLEIHEGSPAEVLARIATLRNADEIVVGTRGGGPLRAAIGSVAQRLVRTAGRPVLVTPTAAHHTAP